MSSFAGPLPPRSRSRREGTTLPWQRWLPGLLVLSGVGAYVAVASLQQDFTAFFVAARSLAVGRNPYLNETPALWDGISVFRHSRFLYPPLFALALRPLAALPFPVAKALFTAGALGAWVVALRGLTAELGLRSTTQRWAVAFSVCFPPVWLTLERGQTDLFALACLVGAVRRRDEPGPAGLWVAAAIFLKPMLAPALLALGLGRRGRAALVASGCLLASFVLGALLVSGSLTRHYLAEVLPRVASVGEGGRAGELLSEDELTAREALLDQEGRPVMDGVPFAPEPFDVRRSASLTRVLAPNEPNALGRVLPPCLYLAWLIYVFRRGCGSPWAWAALPLAIVASAPTGWAMSLTLGLPLACLVLARLQESEGGSRVLVWRLLLAGTLALLAGPWLPGAWVVAALCWVAGASVEANAIVELAPVAPASVTEA